MEVLYFSAPWCGPCQKYRPLVLRVIEEYPNIKLRQINVDDELNLALAHNIYSVPTLVAPKNKARLTGAANEETLRGWLSDLS